MIKINDIFWFNYFKTYDILNNVHPYNNFLKKIIDNVKIYKGVRVLDAGSGTGNLSIALSKLGAEVYSLDNSKIGLRIHLRKYPAAKILFHDLAEILPFKDNFFDYVISLNAVCFVDIKKRGGVFKEFYRVLKPGGKIISANLLYNFKPVNIFLLHIKEDVSKNGFLMAFLDIIKKIPSIFKMFYYANVIKKNSKINSFFYLDEQYNYMVGAGFQNITKPFLVFGKQAVLNIALK